MRLLTVVALLVACDKPKKPTVPPNTGSGSAAVAPKTGSGSAHFTGRAESEPCNDVHECALRDNCGCSCEAVVLSAARQRVCDETCGMNACEGYTLFCDTALHRCGAIPKAPPP